MLDSAPRPAVTAFRMDQEHLPDSILIVDFGSQVTQLIARRVREAGVYSEIAPFSMAQDAFRRLNPKGIILSGVARRNFSRLASPSSAFATASKSCRTSLAAKCDPVTKPAKEASLAAPI